MSTKLIDKLVIGNYMPNIGVSDEELERLISIASTTIINILPQDVEDKINNNEFLTLTAMQQNAIQMATYSYVEYMLKNGHNLGIWGRNASIGQISGSITAKFGDNFIPNDVKEYLTSVGYYSTIMSQDFNEGGTPTNSDASGFTLAQRQYLFSEFLSQTDVTRFEKFITRPATWSAGKKYIPVGVNNQIEYTELDKLGLGSNTSSGTTTKAFPVFTYNGQEINQRDWENFFNNNNDKNESLIFIAEITNNSVVGVATGSTKRLLGVGTRTEFFLRDSNKVYEGKADGTKMALDSAIAPLKQADYGGERTDDTLVTKINNFTFGGTSPATAHTIGRANHYGDLSITEQRNYMLDHAIAGQVFTASKGAIKLKGIVDTKTANTIIAWVERPVDKSEWVITITNGDLTETGYTNTTPLPNSQIMRAEVEVMLANQATPQALTRNFATYADLDTAHTGNALIQGNQGVVEVMHATQDLPVVVASGHTYTFKAGQSAYYYYNTNGDIQLTPTGADAFMAVMIQIDAERDNYEALVANTGYHAFNTPITGSYSGGTNGKDNNTFTLADSAFNSAPTATQSMTLAYEIAETATPNTPVYRATMDIALGTNGDIDIGIITGANASAVSAKIDFETTNAGAGTRDIQTSLASGAEFSGGHIFRLMGYQFNSTPSVVEATSTNGNEIYIAKEVVNTEDHTLNHTLTGFTGDLKVKVIMGYGAYETERLMFNTQRHTKTIAGKRVPWSLAWGSPIVYENLQNLNVNITDDGTDTTIDLSYTNPKPYKTTGGVYPDRPTIFGYYITKL